MAKNEQVCFIDLTDSQNDPLWPGSDTLRKTVTIAAFRVFVRKLKELDDAATDAAMAGRPEAKKGGILTFGFHGRNTVEELEDVNLGNIEDAIAKMVFTGSTYVMPSLVKWQGDRDEEFSADEIHDINRRFNLLFLTDGLIYDEPQFLQWVERQPNNHRVYFVMIGRDDDTPEALQGYQRIAQAHPNQVFFYDMTHSSDPEAIANQMVQTLI